ncbi:MAG: hypothetical protein ACM3VZ_11520 [Acidobacteriota bacterium]
MMRSLSLASLVLYTGLACAESTQAGVWYGTSTDEIIATHVQNDDGSMLSFLCTKSDKSCLWTISVGLTCDEKYEQPALAATRMGSAHITMVCNGKLKESNLYMLYAKEYEMMNSLVSRGGVMGIALAKDDGQFIAFRFNVDGAKAAIENIASALDRLPASKKPASIRSNTF